MSVETVNINGMVVSSMQNFLIVDDEGDMNELIAELLQYMGFNGECYQAYSIEDSKKYLAKYKIDYILSDWNLPDGEGISLLKAIRKSERFCHIPFLMITANSEVESMVASSRLGVSEYLIKPFTQEELQEKLVGGWRSHIQQDEAEVIKGLKKKIDLLEVENSALRSENKILKDKIKNY